MIADARAVSFLALAFGVINGLRHAFEPDHLSAVATLVAARRDSRVGAMVGAAWGVGHSATLLLVGAIAMLVGARVPLRAEQACEFAVAIMLVLLGARSLFRAIRARAEDPPLTLRRDSAHHVRAFELPLRPLVIGMIHGLAGSGAVTALAFGHYLSTAAGIAFIALFGVGSMAGMAALTGAIGAPVARVAQSPRAAMALLAGTGVFSLALGVAIGIRAGTIISAGLIH